MSFQKNLFITFQKVESDAFSGTSPVTPVSRSDPIGGSELGPGRETIYWDSH